MEWYQILTIIGIPSVCSAIFIAIGRILIKKLNNIIKEFALLKKGEQMTLRLTLRNDGEKYIKQGYCTIDRKNDYEDAYLIYHNLGENGVMTTMYNTVLSLPNEPIKKPYTKHQSK